MDSQVLFFVTALLLPVAALSGWLYGRREVGPSSARREPREQIATDYFKGLNYLLHDRPDKAIEVLVKVLEVDAETVETHLALGNLFRRRGEVDRAIRIHQNLVARTTLDVTQRGQALLELGLDYMRSGLFDRAENLFLELLDRGLYQPAALRHLIDIYQQEQDWEKALEFSTRLEAVNGENLSVARAHFLCEQAQQQIELSNRNEAQELLERALSADRKCVRASLMSANLAMSNREFERAIQALKRIEHQDVDYIGEAIVPLVKCYRALERMDELKEYLERLAGLRAGVTPLLAVAELTEADTGLDAAKQYIVQELKIRPTLKGIDRLIDYTLHSANGESREDLLILKETTVRLIASKALYKCEQCGFSGRSVYWNCPSCKSWNTIKPIHGIEGE
ncbi:MAG: lipopolysaccharide assembly protein LapB [Gammaproteobacteria bacterium]|nr:lipopolysaccharide assembly protein LapB [Gammaproteobacteria bacterium]